MKSSNHGQEASGNESMAAVCGLYCEACTIYIGTQEDPARLSVLAGMFGVPEAELLCSGCRSERRTAYCAQCRMSSCAAEKGIRFCGECGEYPCGDIKAFQAQAPHRLELWDAQERIKGAGVDIWLREMKQRYSCSTCGVLNSAYDIVCRNCGTEPGNEYVAEHRANIQRSLHEEH